MRGDLLWLAENALALSMQEVRSVCRTMQLARKEIYDMDMTPQRGDRTSGGCTSKIHDLCRSAAVHGNTLVVSNAEVENELSPPPTHHACRNLQSVPPTLT